jgi:hypothetical protein
MKPASSSFLIFSRMKFCCSTDCFWGLYWTGLASGQIFRWCSITSLEIPDICDGCQANTSTLARRKVMSASFYLLSRSLEIRVVCPASVLTWMVFTGTSSLPEGCTRGAEAELRWRELGGAGSWPPGSSAAS